MVTRRVAPLRIRLKRKKGKKERKRGGKGRLVNRVSSDDSYESYTVTGRKEASGGKGKKKGEGKKREKKKKKGEEKRDIKLYLLFASLQPSHLKGGGGGGVKEGGGGGGE